MMHTIEVSEENRERITRGEYFSIELIDLDTTIKSQETWYYVDGYIDRDGKRSDWALLPADTLQAFFDFDADKIKTEWVEIAHKEL